MSWCQTYVPLCWQPTQILFRYIYSADVRWIVNPPFLQFYYISVRRECRHSLPCCSFGRQGARIYNIVRLQMLVTCSGFMKVAVENKNAWPLHQSFPLQNKIGFSLHVKQAEIKNWYWHKLLLYFDLSKEHPLLPTKDCDLYVGYWFVISCQSIRRSLLLSMHRLITIFFNSIWQIF